MSCPVCFNAAVSDDSIRTSLNLGIFVMMGVTACVLAGFMRFIISITRKSYSKADLKVGLYDNASLKVGLYDYDNASLSTCVEADLQVRLPR